MNRLEETPIASTTLDLFDKKSRLRQGTWNLKLWKNKNADLSLSTETPGLDFNKEQLNDDDQNQS